MLKLQHCDPSGFRAYNVTQLCQVLLIKQPSGLS